MLYDLLAESPGVSSDGLAIMDDVVAGGGTNNVNSVFWWVGGHMMHLMVLVGRKPVCR